VFAGASALYGDTPNTQIEPAAFGGSVPSLGLSLELPYTPQRSSGFTFAGGGSLVGGTGSANVPSVPSTAPASTSGGGSAPKPPTTSGGSTSSSPGTTPTSGGSTTTTLPASSNNPPANTPGVPDGGATAAMLGSALLGLGLVRRRFAK
jgi:hypothetical protein